MKYIDSSGTTYYPNKYFNSDDTKETKHIFANGTAIATIEDGSVNYTHTDHLTGSNIVSNTDGDVVQVLDYYPYGDLRINDQYGFDEQRKFTGHEYDADTGLTYMNARYQDGQIGRFLSQDPLVNDLGTNKKQFREEYNKNLYGVLIDPQQLNSYSYARNNPLKYTDPEGEAIFAIIAAVAYAVFEVGSTLYDIGSFSFTYFNPESTEIQRQQALDWVAIGMMVPGSGKFADDIFDISRTSVKAGDKVAGLKVTTHAAEGFTERNMKVNQVGTALDEGVKYLDNKTGNILHVVGEQGKKGYTIVTDQAQKVLVSVENFVRNLTPPKSPDRFKKLK